MVGQSNVENAPYNIIKSDAPYEIRHYERLVLVSTPMEDGMNERGNPFGRLFDYISGENQKNQEIPMTAPVFMDQNSQDNTQATMSFVMPNDFSLIETPPPNDPNVRLEELNDYTVATIQFSGRLTDDNIQEHQALLKNWVAFQELEVTGPVKVAGYNPPFTIPALRRNEILMPVKLQGIGTAINSEESE